MEVNFHIIYKKLHILKNNITLIKDKPYLKHEFPDINECKIAVIDLGYVGLPLAIQISKIDICLKIKKINREIIGFDISNSRSMN